MTDTHRRRNKLNKVKVNGRWLTEESEIKEEVSRAFQGLLADLGGWKPNIDGFIFESLEELDVEGLEKPFSEEVFGGGDELLETLVKVLANKLKGVLAKVISTSQNAFAEGQQIMDAVLIANEAINSILKTMFEKMGFGEMWHRWIKWCLSTARFSVMVNGSPTGFFQSSRGLRQGDLFLPYLFIIVMETFNYLLKIAVSEGLRVNLEKSELISVGRVENVEELADEFGYKVGRLPSTYLGMPLVIRRKYREERGGWSSCEAREANGVGLWKAISKMGHLVTPSFDFVVGDGKKAWVNEVWTAAGETEGSWSPCFNRPFNDWELEEVERLFYCLDGKKVSVDEEDRSILSFFAWEASWGRVLTLDRLQKRGWALANRCFPCQTFEESIDYLLHCEKTREVWMLLLSLFGVSWVFPFSVKETLLGWRGSFVGKKRKEVWQVGPLCLFWVIWKARNRIAFENSVLSIQRLQGNPICSNANIVNIHLFCGSESGGEENPESSTNSTDNCRIQECLTDDFFEYVPASPIPCFCASPLRVGYRLKSPSFSYFIPYESPFEKYVTSVLNMELYQLHIDSFFWEEGPRLRMHFKLFQHTIITHSIQVRFCELEASLHHGTFLAMTFLDHMSFSASLSWDLIQADMGLGCGSEVRLPVVLVRNILLWVCFDSATHGKSLSMGIWVAILLGAIACAIAISITVTLLIVRRHSKYQNTVSRRRLSSTISMKIDGVRDFTYREMALATDNFNDSTQVGQGGYGRVYKGILYDNTVVAIKRAQEGSLQGQKEFLTEIQLLSRLHHRNLVSLIGYCAEEGEQMLVYEFMPNGTLRDWLSAKSKTLIFSTRLRIALGSAKGILYLHTEAQPPIFHRDIKASNILLDSKFTPKVADFGLSRLAPDLEDEGAVPNHVSTIVKGTPGYLDPEYFLTRKLTDKSDVYSLGVVFLEILTGMQPISHGKNIVREVNMSHQLGMVFSIIDNKMGSYPSECVERFLALALRCCHDKPEDRPSMLDVVRELENILRMMPEIETQSSESASHSGKLLSLPSSSYVSRDLYSISNASGSDLVSGVIPTIAPR
ncbi:putative LRR receptor-like serine/threonine-protein kinase [Vitis vinifera]|uniref:non-specific serine/threonine protein kinase n=1 Tax=Vitis vinifera TaxID=29760 RepID=A0A438D4J3_VITVI|nr:putative LRR receptor-like serine/threonine-protein kinase [Vitis vinifera]